MDEGGFAAGLGACKCRRKVSCFGDTLAMPAKGLSISCKVGVAQVCATGTPRVIPFLVHAYRPIHGVVDDEYDDGQIILHCGCELLAMHHKEAVTGKADDCFVGQGTVGGDCCR